MSYLNKVFNFLKEKKYIAGAIVVVLVVLGVFVFRNKSTSEDTFVVSHSNFVNQVSVSGKVVAASDVSLGFSTGGRVSSVRVKVGDVVNSGTVLASVENGDLRAGLEQKQADLLREQAKLNSLKAGTRPEQLAITESSLASAQTAFNQAKQSLINSINDAYTKSDDAIKNKIDQFFRNPLTRDPYIVLSVSDNSLINYVNKERVVVGDKLSLWEQSISKVISEDDLEKYTKEVEDNMLQIKNFLAKVSLITNNPEVTYSNGAVPSTWKTDTSTARLAIDTSISSLATAVTSYKSAQSDLIVKQNNLKLEQAGATTEDIDAQVAQVKGAEAGVLNAQAMLNKTLIVAPFTGQITKIDAKVGEVASSNVPLISMMSADTFQIESYVPEISIAQIKLGDEAQVTLDAYGESVPFAAVVISIDPAETIRDGVSTYKIKLKFNGNDDRIKSGMTANVSITTFVKQNVVVVPGGVIFEKNGKNFVQVKVDKKIIDKEVVLGAVSSLGKTEIVSGLVDGDLVILNPKLD